MVKGTMDIIRTSGVAKIFFWDRQKKFTGRTNRLRIMELTNSDCRLSKAGNNLIIYTQTHTLFSKSRDRQLPRLVQCGSIAYQDQSRDFPYPPFKILFCYQHNFLFPCSVYDLISEEIRRSLRLVLQLVQLFGHRHCFLLLQLGLNTHGCGLSPSSSKLYRILLGYGANANNLTTCRDKMLYFSLHLCSLENLIFFVC